MLVKCYRSYAEPIVQDQLFHLCLKWGGWISTRPDCLLCYIPENKSFWAELLDGTLQRYSKEDYLV